jgi:hypothetical protein
MPIMRKDWKGLHEARVIYMLTINDRPCYIGMTMLKRMNQRKRNHLYGCSCDSDAKLHLDATMERKGLKYGFLLLEVIEENLHTFSRAIKAERQWICLILETGAYLLNKHAVPKAFLDRSGMSAAEYHVNLCLPISNS